MQAAFDHDIVVAANFSKLNLGQLVHVYVMKYE